MMIYHSFSQISFCFDNNKHNNRKRKRKKEQKKKQEDRRSWGGEGGEGKRKEGKKRKRKKELDSSKPLSKCYLKQGQGQYISLETISCSLWKSLK